MICIFLSFFIIILPFSRCQFRVDCIEIKQSMLFNYLVPVLLRFNCTCTRYHNIYCRNQTRIEYSPASKTRWIFIKIKHLDVCTRKLSHYITHVSNLTKSLITNTIYYSYRKFSFSPKTTQSQTLEGNQKKKKRSVN